MKASVVIPAFNAENTIGLCLCALSRQTIGPTQFEIIVVNDGSTDNTAQVCSSFVGVRLLNQANAGPAAARNLGARSAKGEIIVFTDSDCEPTETWLEEMLKPFDDPMIVGVKGVYRTRQEGVVAQFVQLEYESRYRIMRRYRTIDFVDTYSAAFRRNVFLQHGGYNTSFPVACVEDQEFSFRLKEHGAIMVFNPKAVVFHTHSDTVRKYFLKKMKIAYWRLAATRMHPQFAIKDSHTPQLMKLQVLALGAFVALLPFALALRSRLLFISCLLSLLVFCLLSVPFYISLILSNWKMLVAGPYLMVVRSLGQGWGLLRRLLDSFLGRHRLSALEPAGSVPASISRKGIQ